jgi:Family of unknown function (DUF6118)
MADTEHPSDQDASGDAAQAFEALRAEVIRIGRDIGALHTALIEHRGPDLTPTLGEIAKAQQLAAKKLHAIEQHPAIRMTGEQYRQTLENAGTALVQESARRVQEASWSVAGEAKRLEATIGAARTKRRQLEVLAGVAGAALLIGILLSPFLARLLPFGLDENIAAVVLHADRWNAGMRLMASANPEAWHDLRASIDLFRVNQGALDQCREAAATAKKAQRCTLTVSAAE